MCVWVQYSHVFLSACSCVCEYVCVCVCVCVCVQTCRPILGAWCMADNDVRSLMNMHVTSHVCVCACVSQPSVLGFSSSSMAFSTAVAGRDMATLLNSSSSVSSLKDPFPLAMVLCSQIGTCSSPEDISALRHMSTELDVRSVGGCDALCIDSCIAALSACTDRDGTCEYIYMCMRLC